MEFFILVIGIIGVYLSLTLKYVSAPHKWVIEKNYLGKFDKFTWETGIHFLWLPVKPLMFVRNKLDCSDRRILITIGVDDENPGDPGKVEFLDTQSAVKTQLILRVTDPEKATYEVSNGDYEKAVITRVEADFRRKFSECNLDKAMKMKKDIAEKVLEDLNEFTEDKWGVKVTAVDILDFILDETSVRIREQLLLAEKAAQAEVAKAEGEKKSRVIRAKGVAEAAVVEAEGKKKASIELIKGVAEGTGLEPVQVMANTQAELLYKAMDSATIIATSEGGNLNFPVAVATMNALTDGMKKKGGGNP